MLAHSAGSHPRRLVRTISKRPWLTALPSWPGAFMVRRRILIAGLGGVALLLPLLAIAPAQAATEGPITEFAVPQGGVNTQVGDDGQLALGSDGDLYFATGDPVGIGRITPSGQITEFTAPDTQSSIYLTVPGPDGDVWFAGNGTGGSSSLGSITPEGQITTFSVPSFGGEPDNGIISLAAGSNGDLWFTANAGTARAVRASFVGELNPATGAITEFPTPSTDALPGTLTLGSDGNLWFAEENSNSIARITS